MKLRDAVVLAALACLGWASTVQAQESAVGAEPSRDLPVDVTADRVADRAAEDMAMNMLQLRLQACEQRSLAPCPVAAPSTDLRASVGLWGSAYRYSQPWNLSTVSAGTLLLGVDGSRGGLWVATGLSQTGLRYESSDFQQATHLFGATGRFGDATVAVTAGQLSTTASSSNGTWLGLVETSAWWGSIGGDLQVAVSRYPSFWWLQADPTLLVHMGSLKLGLGAQVQKGQGVWRLSPHLGATWHLSDRLDLSAMGWYGRRQRSVEAGGLSVWTSDDLLKGGYRLGAALHTGAVTWELNWLHDLGISQSGLSHDFAIYGATAGIRVNF